ncbi:MAG: membrane protein insertion efficiency factor YidD [Rhizobiales bacterium]|nr:membrane protein insertion efficiency factor YidD [Hyphomicrobiales bacterium]
MKTILVAVIRVYQLTLSALIGRRCRYLPTCAGVETKEGEPDWFPLKDCRSGRFYQVKL